MVSLNDLYDDMSKDYNSPIMDVEYYVDNKPPSPSLGRTGDFPSIIMDTINFL